MIRKLMAVGAALVVPIILLSMLWFSRSAAAVGSGVIQVCSSCTYTTISGAVLDATGGDVIQVEPGTYAENVVISRSVTIEGQGAGVIVDGNDLGTVFTIDPGVTVTIKNLTIQNGLFTEGGGVSNEGTVFIVDTVIQDNEATDSLGGGGGGGIANFGVMSLTHVTITGNRADFGAGINNVVLLTAEYISVTENSTLTNDDLNTGGGLANEGELSLTKSMVSGNSAGASGGGIDNTGTMTVTMSTVYQNFATKSGGGVNNEGDFSATNSTFSGNSALIQGGGVYNHGVAATAVLNSSAIYNNSTGLGSQVGGVSSVTGTVTLNNSMVAHLVGAAAGFDCSTSNIVSAGSNLDSDGSCGLGAGELSAVGDPHLGPLQNNGGATWTHALLPHSRAVDAATNACEATDQRGVARPVGTACDIGPYETAVYKTYLPAIFKD